MESHLPNIPQELILEEILPRLPSKSLLRFQSVSKTWHAFISDPKFSFKTKTYQIASITRPYPCQDFHDADYEQYRLPFVPEHESVTVFFSYNGLLLLDVSGSVFLFNPSTREYSKLFDAPDNDIILGGICYDFSTSDYKVVVEVSSGSGPDILSRLLYTQLKLYSVRTKTWKPLQRPLRFNGFRRCGPVIDEKIHWLAYEQRSFVGDDDGREIFYFDASEDKFVGVPSPQPQHGKKNDIVQLFAIGGCLAMARMLGDCADSCEGVLMEVLVMKDYGVKESWTLLFSLSNFNGCDPESFDPIYLNSDGELLGTVGSWGTRDLRGKIVAYNKDKGTYREVFAAEIGFRVRAVVYMESLVRPSDLLHDTAEESQ